MKIKLWQWEYDFDKEDAKIVIPLLLLLLGLIFTPLDKATLWVGGVAYYLLYFFLKPTFVAVKEKFLALHHWLTFKCPYCKSREVILPGAPYLPMLADVGPSFSTNSCSEFVNFSPAPLASGNSLLH